MGWWQIGLAALTGIVALLLVMLWLDTVRERPNYSTDQSIRVIGIAAIAIPIIVAIVLFTPLWVGIIVAAIILLTLATMAFAS